MTTHFNTLAAAEKAAKPGDVIWSVFRDGELHYELNISDRELWVCHGGSICHICHETDTVGEQVQPTRYTVRCGEWYNALGPPGTLWASYVAAKSNNVEEAPLAGRRDEVKC